MRKLITALVLLSGAAMASGLAQAEHDARHATLYKQPQCGCCTAHADYLRANGFLIDEVEVRQPQAFKEDHGIPREMAGCHTIKVGGYLVEGHVSADLIDRLLDERPDVAGISLPGMPTGSPGMPGPKPEPHQVYSFGDNGIAEYGTQ